MGERLDTVICLNVLEHVRDDMLSLASVHRLLQPGGRLVLLVPAMPSLYGTLDRALGHFRRYTAAELRHVFAAAGFRLRHLEYFNLAGVPGWWLTGRVLKRTLIPTGSLRLYDALVPLFRLERFLPWRLGQSLIAIGERPA
jgi:SAM-dependent methyltransferase